ncbi:MAG: divalent-cation tolerance protein CutA [Gammaproteobacteria bacterium]|nr:divalent-cation tolerance protein CutA [Gammaproteobacteria bacterium]
MKNKVIVVLSQCPDEATAERLALRLLEERLAACVNWLPGARSAYWWQGQIQRDTETLLLAKTTAERLGQLTARLTELHPYDVPEILALEVAGGAERYLDWVGQTLGADEQAGPGEREQEHS